jgi:hypothetical protein
MMEIRLTQGKIALVDDVDFDRVNKYRWCYQHGYAVHNTRQNEKIIRTYLHHFIFGRPIRPNQIDHIDGNGLNNQKSNLRIVTARQNCQNKHIKKSSKFVGVCKNKAGGKKWRAVITINGVQQHLGLFRSEKAAALCYSKAASDVSP